MAAVQFLYSWEINKHEFLSEGLRLFFEDQDQPRAYYQFEKSLFTASSTTLNPLMRSFANAQQIGF